MRFVRRHLTEQRDLMLTGGRCLARARRFDRHATTAAPGGTMLADERLREDTDSRCIDVL
jgi:hypothetical protein